MVYLITMPRYLIQTKLFSTMRSIFGRNTSIDISRRSLHLLKCNTTTFSAHGSIQNQSCVTPWSSVSCRYFVFKALNRIYNSPDMDRIAAVGPERSCAEWCLKCGAHIRWAGSNEWITEYSLLPRHDPRLVLEEINAHEAGMMDVGFAHMHRLRGLKKLRFFNCPYLKDRELEEMEKVKDTLQSLEIDGCVHITEKGLHSLKICRNLEYLVLRDLPGVDNIQECIAFLQEQLPGCDISYKDS